MYTLSLFDPLARTAGGLKQKLEEKVLTFHKDQHGSATVEYVLWFPFFIVFTLFIVDTTVTLHQHARMWDTARYTARLVSTGDASTAAAVKFAESSLSPEFEINIDNTTDSDLVVVSIAGYGGLSISTPLDLLGNPRLSAVYVMRNET